MRGFQDRIQVDECATVFDSARQAGFIRESTTSLIVHDLGRMKGRIETLKSAFPESTLHTLAIKANPLVEILREAVRAGTGLEAASIEEVQLAIAAGCKSARIVFDSPAKTVDEIRAALEMGILLNANSLDELDRIGSEWIDDASNSQIGVRVNPELGAGRIAHTSVAKSDSKFGVLLDASREQIIAAFKKYRWLTGLHVHVGSQGCELEMLVEAASRIHTLRGEIESASGRPIEFVDIGGGLPTVYAADATSPSPHDYVAMLQQSVPELMDGGVELITEFGRAIQAGCGVTFSRVEYVRPEQSMAVVHVGADFLMRPVYASNDWKHEFFVLDPQGRPKQSDLEPLNIAGPLCFSGDIIARQVPLPRVEPGDWLVVRDTGAYTLGMWSRHCSRSIPTVVGFDPDHNPTVRLLRKGETPSSVTRFWDVDGGR